MAANVIADGLGTYISYLFILSGVIVLFWRLLSSPRDPREPPLIKPSIPIVGHIIGIFRHKMEYFEILSAKNPPPICSIEMGLAKVHIVMSPDVVQNALRNRALSFDPFSMAFAKRVLGAKSEKFVATCYIPKNDKELCYSNEMHKVYHEPLQPGPDLQQTNAAMLRQVSKFMNEIGPEYEQKELYTWIRDSFTVATSIALFGSRNPFASDPSLTEALWDFEGGVQMLMLDFLPHITARKAHAGRAKVQAALRAYFRAGHDLDADVSTFIKRRAATQRRWGFASDEFADWDLAMIMVATTNAIPMLFWTLVYVLAAPPAVAARVRAEVAAVTARSPGRAVIDASRFAACCPLLCAAYQEATRLAVRHMSFRVANQDTTLAAAGDDAATYRIRKNAVVLLPSSLYSENPAVWGADAHVFEPGRWLKRGDADAGAREESAAAGPAAKDAERLQKKAFFPFGGGRHLCPGRHFASAEILGMVALVVAGFDVVRAEDEGPLQVPPRESRFFGEVVPKPVGRYDVLIKRREEFEGLKWEFALGSA